MHHILPLLLNHRVFNNSLPPFSSEDSIQPELYHTLDPYSTSITLLPYTAGWGIGIILALFCCCFTPTRRLLHSIDAFSSTHSDQLDPQTNSGPKIVRKTGMGGLLTLIYGVFVICVAVSIFVQWKLNTITDIRLNTFCTHFILTDYQGYCVENSPSTTTEFGTCISDITLNTTTIHFYGLYTFFHSFPLLLFSSSPDSDHNAIPLPFECKQDIYSNTIRNTTHTHCTIFTLYHHSEPCSILNCSVLEWIDWVS